MAGKRSATSDLNHENWDRDDKVEDAGTFRKAPEEVLKQRIIKTAKRRNPEVSTGNGEDGVKKPVFGGFTGFASFAPPNPNAAFSFLNNSNTFKSTQPQPTGTSTANSTTTTKLPNTSIFSSGLTNGVDSKTDKKATTLTPSFPSTFDTNSDKSSTNDSKTDKIDLTDDRTEYYAKLKGLNESVLSWIDKHVKENPFINLKPIFTDYERYLTDLEIKHVAVSAETKKELVGFSFKSTNDAKSFVKSSPSAFSSTNESSFAPATEKPQEKLQFSAGSSLFGGKTTSEAPAAEKFSFGTSPGLSNQQKNSESDKTTPSFVFGSVNAAKSSATSITGAGFGSTTLFGGSKPIAASSAPFSFGTPANSPPAFASTPSTQTETINLNEDEDDEPPKVEFTPVVEQDHIYTIRCKVFVKKDGNFGDRGVGNLYLKTVPDSEKVQLIVRADTNLGNLLCNFILSESIPTQRMGKKDVMLVCIPMPDEKPPPVPMLLRVKNEQEADALLKELEKHKK